ncbi:uncharacterized protein BO66DRAFT_404042 [Aspergillus aculeatinus CBS 121060]|uniref:Uncharacterized protein n=1 Tax=Aspergillus aculeatinus CBS 121060 TaxID=1448322 RepID=A0ACD1H0Z3_9EURO|nr:hypothetical protein BO66DRAFT_404042 [Aspergillus aculeatinus CBS 121060]RAH67134.1 hypothetical protein BO66DRAFT_404042 [Aspergillus aculeatinus CBS 121060]
MHGPLFHVTASLRNVFTATTLARLYQQYDRIPSPLSTPGGQRPCWKAGDIKHPNYLSDKHSSDAPGAFLARSFSAWRLCLPPMTTALTGFPALVEAPPNLTGVVGQLRCYYSKNAEILEARLEGSPRAPQWTPAQSTGMHQHANGSYLRGAFTSDLRSDHSSETNTVSLCLSLKGNPSSGRGTDHEGEDRLALPRPKHPLRPAARTRLGYLDPAGGHHRRADGGHLVRPGRAILAAGHCGCCESLNLPLHPRYHAGNNPSPEVRGKKVFELHRDGHTDPSAAWTSREIFHAPASDSTVNSTAACLNKEGLWVFVKCSETLYLLRRGYEDQRYQGGENPWVKQPGFAIGAVSAWDSAPRIFLWEIADGQRTVIEASTATTTAAGGEPGDWIDIFDGSRDQGRKILHASVVLQQGTRTSQGPRPETVTLAYKVDDAIHTRVWDKERRQWSDGPVVCASLSGS